MTYLLIAPGLALLLAGAYLLVEGGATLGRRFGVSELAIGLTVVSIGTSVPELVVSVMASLQGNSELAISNVLGSNIANSLLILGVAAMVRSLSVTDRTLLSEIPFTLAAALLVGFLANAALFSTTRELTISRLDGAILLGFFVLFLTYVVRTSNYGETPNPETGSVVTAAARIVGGSLCLMLGGRLAVDGALDLSAQLGVSESLVGLTVVAVGTSAPELVASAVAAYRGKGDIAVGNVVGSNIFNLLWVLGVSALIQPLPFNVLSNTDLVMVIASSALLIVAVVVGRPSAIARWEGTGLVMTYVAYLVFIGARG